MIIGAVNAQMSSPLTAPRRESEAGPWELGPSGEPKRGRPTRQHTRAKARRKPVNSPELGGGRSDASSTSTRTHARTHPLRNAFLFFFRNEGKKRETGSMEHGRNWRELRDGTERTCVRRKKKNRACKKVHGPTVDFAEAH
ncbi:hypothetical protein NL676_033081 [Syzygium grande]|nr:hypothetical protein NL676_033081 [Syzygium grande]